MQALRFACSSTSDEGLQRKFLRFARLPGSADTPSGFIPAVAGRPAWGFGPAGGSGEGLEQRPPPRQARARVGEDRAQPADRLVDSTKMPASTSITPPTRATRRRRTPCAIRSPAWGRATGSFRLRVVDFFGSDENRIMLIAPGRSSPSASTTGPRQIDFTSRPRNRQRPPVPADAAARAECWPESGSRRRVAGPADRVRIPHRGLDRTSLALAHLPEISGDKPASLPSATMS